jgi:hypothetical protein
MIAHVTPGAYFFTNSQISSSEVPGAMLPIQSFISRLSHDAAASLTGERQQGGNDTALAFFPFLACPIKSLQASPHRAYWTLVQPLRRAGIGRRPC